ncbi:MAG: TonB family protein [Gammaproteobacteria bacterium]
MQKRLFRLLAVIPLLFAAIPAPAQDVSEEFIKTYRAYDRAYRQGNLERASELAEKTLRIAVDELGPDHEKIPVLLINLGHVRLLNGNIDDAEKYLTEAKGLIKDEHDDARGNRITIHEDMARIHASRDELEKSRAELDKAIDLRSRENGDDDPAIADLLDMKARLEIARQEFDSAESLLNQGMKIIEKNYGKDSNRIAGFLSSLGDLAVLRDQLDKAEKLYLQGLAILNKNLLADDPNVLGMHQKLANLYIAMGSDKFMSHADTFIAESDLKEGAALPYFVIKPDKPGGANIDSGWVLLEMTVTETGHVQNPRVIESRPPGVLDSVTLNAARKWRFKPKIEDGERLAQPKTRARIVFQGDKVEVHLGEMG